MSIEHDMPAYYARRAAEYERIYDKPERQNDLRELRAFVEAMFAGQDVFEVACGTGYWTQFGAPRARSWLATDYNEETLQIARAKNIQSPGLIFAQADAYALPPARRHFTAGLAAFWWSHVPKARLAAFLAHFHALFPPGARLVFIDNRYVPGSSSPMSRIDPCDDTFQLLRLADGSEHEVLKNFPTEEELLNAVANTALRPEIRRLNYYWILSYALK